MRDDFGDHDDKDYASTLWWNILIKNKHQTYTSRHTHAIYVVWEYVQTVSDELEYHNKQ